MPVGLLIGLALGALGGGGSILAVPALVYLLDQSPQQATAGSLVVVGVAATAALVSQAGAGHVRWRRGLTFSALGVAGSVLGAHLSNRVDPDLLLLGFSGLLAVAAVAMTRRRTSVSSAPVARGGRPRRCLPRTALAATAVGLLTGFFGVGGGFVVVPALVLVLGFDLTVAIGTSLLVIALNSAVSLAARSTTALHLDWSLLAVFAAAAVLGAWAGQRLAGRLPAVALNAAFTWMLVVLAGAIAVSSATQLL